MPDYIQLIVGIVFLILGVPIGSFIAKKTKEELSKNQKWFKLIIALSVIGAIVGLALGNDICLFSFLFIIIVTSRSLLKK